MLLQRSLKEEKQKLHLALEKALGWGNKKNNKSTTSSLGAIQVKLVQPPISIEQVDVTDQHMVRKQKLTTLLSLVNSLAVVPLIPHRFISIEEEFKNDAPSTATTAPRCFPSYENSTINS
jgi:hypothetical protein